MKIIEKAIEVATQAHDQQLRKCSGIPYVSHPLMVGIILMKAGCKEELVAAGILHDVVEDTEWTLDEIREEFGEQIADIVKGCSEPDKSLSWEDRKQHTIEFLKDAPLEVKLVAGADKLHNSLSILEEQRVLGERVWEAFKRGREKQAWYYQGLVDSLCQGLSDQEKKLFIFEDLRHTVTQLFGEKPA
ncbi:HD domain-containing protein [Ammoniphilus sp. YIM 78166]|uniref:HD domain-containing protein n=1 Tax=Ammoniphilus sp. YIM 78166 TaxID=1644106 RepID=UPI00106F1F5F|nr:HD domain-containing protein [Ammoniphilus sp. YIM 78166]